jgi:hypothetical protein
VHKTVHHFLLIAEGGELSDADVEYIRAHYVTLDELCAGRAESPESVRRLIEQRRLPRPAYVLPDGTGMFPADYFRLVDEAGGADGLREHFAARHRAADGKDLEQDWEMYLDGIWGICLKDVTPETIVRKRVLIDEIERLLAEPTHDFEWRTRLRAAVDELDAIEKPFAPDYDRNGRFVPTRDTYIRDVRSAYPQLWA